MSEQQEIEVSFELEMARKALCEQQDRIEALEQEIGDLKSLLLRELGLPFDTDKAAREEAEEHYGENHSHF